MTKLKIFSLIVSSLEKDLIALFNANKRLQRRIDSQQANQIRQSHKHIVYALQNTLASSALWSITAAPQVFMRWVLRELYEISNFSQESVGWKIGQYSQSYVSRILNPADTTLTLHPSQYRRWLAVFLTTDELALLA